MWLGKPVEKCYVNKKKVQKAQDTLYQAQNIFYSTQTQETITLTHFHKLNIEQAHTPGR